MYQSLVAYPNSDSESSSSLEPGLSGSSGGSGASAASAAPTATSPAPPAVVEACLRSCQSLRSDTVVAKTAAAVKEEGMMADWAREVMQVVVRVLGQVAKAAAMVVVVMVGRTEMAGKASAATAEG